jgi:hypothetical protein
MMKQDGLRTDALEAQSKTSRRARFRTAPCMIATCSKCQPCSSLQLMMVMLSLCQCCSKPLATTTARTNLVPTAIRTGSAVPNQTLLVLVGVWHGCSVPNVVGTGPPFGTAHSLRCAYRHLARISVPNVVGTGPPFGTAHSLRCAYRHLARCPVPNAMRHR